MRIVILSILLILSQFTISAQNVVASFLDKFGKDENIQVVSIGERMFERIKEQSLGSPELREAIKELDRILVISSEDTTLTDEYFDSAFAILSGAEGYSDLLSFESDTEQQLVVKKKITKGTINELVVLLRSPEGFTLIGIVGKNINLKALAQYSVDANFQILKNLKKFEDKN
jgi:vacuolar-type H+-ATPase subunit F/Vma7